MADSSKIKGNSIIVHPRLGRGRVLRVNGGGWSGVDTVTVEWEQDVILTPGNYRNRNRCAVPLEDVALAS